MNTRTPILTLSLALAAGSLVLAVGCEDEEAAAQSRRHDELVATGLKYSKAIQKDDAAEALAGVVADIRSIGSDSVASHLLEAAVRRDIAGLDMARAAALEARNRAARNDLQSMGDSAARTILLVASHEQFEKNIDRSPIEQFRDQARSGLAKISNTLSALESPINELRVQNQRDQQQVDRLRGQANELRERAFELGDLEGYSPTREAVGIDRRADALEARIRAREIGLLDLESQRALASLRKDQFEAHLETAQAAEADLAEAAANHNQAASGLRAQTDDLRSQFTRITGGIEATQAELDQLYTEIDRNLDDAATGAEAAARASARSAAINALKARILQMEGQAHTMKARGLANQSIIINLLLNAGGAMGVPGDARSRLDAVQQDLEQSRNAASEAYTRAAQAVGGGSGDAAALKSMLESAAKGEVFQVRTPSQPMTRGGGANVFRGSGAASAEDVVNRLTQSGSWEELFTSTLDLLYVECETPAQAAALVAINNVAFSLANLSRAMQEQFGQGLVELMVDQMGSLPDEATGGMPMPLPSDLPSVQEIVSGLQLTTAGGAPALVVPDPSGVGQAEQVPLALRDGRWYIYLPRDAVSEGLQAGAAFAPGGFDLDDDTIQQVPIFAAMANQLISQLTQRVQSGEFATAEDFINTVMAEFQQMAGGFGGGFGDN